MTQLQNLDFLFTSSQANRGQCRLDIDEAFCLFRHIRTLAEGALRDKPNSNLTGVEIGRLHGGSTLLLATALDVKPRQKEQLIQQNRLVSIDKAPRDDEALQRQIRELGLEAKVELVIGDAAAFAYNPQQFPTQLDFVFVDGDHSFEAAKRDHLMWGRRLYPGGFIIHHDMAKARLNATQIKDLARLRVEILTHQANCVELVEEVGSLSVFRRRGGCWKSW